MTDQTNGRYEEALKFAEKIGDDSLKKCMNRLQAQECDDTVVTIFNDIAPYSFYFIKTVNGAFYSNGGVIFHGKHDNGGDGSAPTFSISLTPVNGWSIHT